MVIAQPLQSMLTVSAWLSILLHSSYDVAAQSCYTSIVDINSDMQIELARIAEGGTPEDSYTFELCANTIFDATEALNPVLNNAFFVCGPDGSSSNSCTITGGTTNPQVEIASSTVSGYPLVSVAFSGITFESFSETEGSIKGVAFFPTTATFSDSVWTVSTSRHATSSRGHPLIFFVLFIELCWWLSCKAD